MPFYSSGKLGHVELFSCVLALAAVLVALIQGAFLVLTYIAAAPFFVSADAVAFDFGIFSPPPMAFPVCFPAAVTPAPVVAVALVGSVPVVTHPSQGALAVSAHFVTPACVVYVAVCNSSGRSFIPCWLSHYQVWVLTSPRPPERNLLSKLFVT